MKPSKVKQALTLSFLLLSLAACSQDYGTRTMSNSKKSQVVYMDVSAYAYTAYNIDGMSINGRELMTAGGGGLTTGEAFDLGTQQVSWKDAKDGTVHTAKNTVILNKPTRDETYLSIHIYPDDTVEFIPSSDWPDTTERGEKIYQQMRESNKK